jgi:hypothetical protein
MLKMFTMDLGLRGEPPQGSINSVRGVWSPPADNFPDRLSQATGSDVNRDLQSLVAHPHSAIPQSVVLRAAGEQRRKLPSGRCLVSNFPAEYQTPTEKRLNATSENSSFKASSGYNLLRGRKDCSPIPTTNFPSYPWTSRPDNASRPQVPETPPVRARSGYDESKGTSTGAKYTSLSSLITPGF